MNFCSYVKALIAVCFLCLTASTSLASKVYPDCEIEDSGPGLCIWEWEYDTYIAPRGSDDIAPVVLHKKWGGAVIRKGESSLDISTDGQVDYWEGPEFYEYDPAPQITNVTNVFPSVYKEFTNLKRAEKLELQNILQKLELYRSTIDATFGSDTYIAIFAYNILFNQRIEISTDNEARQLFEQIRNHKKFSYFDESANPQTAGGVDNVLCSDGDAERCSDEWLCYYFGDFPINYNNIYGREVKKRGLTCGSLSAKTEKNIETVKVKTCDDDPNICGAVELCQRASVQQNGKQTWRKSSSAAAYVEAAKSVGLTCNVQNKPDKEEVYRVASGTGFFVSDNGYVVTNQHVIDGCTETRVHSREKTLPSSLIAKDAQNDLALLQVDFTPSQFFRLSEENPSLLQEIIAAGYPFGNRISNSIKVTRGIVSATAGLGDNVSQIQIDAALQPGNSGGPIIDEGGSVVGVAVAKLDAEYTLENFGTLPENTNFGIKVSVVKSLLESNNVPFEESQIGKMQRTQLGKLVTDGTVFLSCWMTTAQYEKMKTKKAMFDEIEKN